MTVPSKATAIVVRFRWLASIRDLESVRRIETASFEFPWTDEDFICCLREPKCTGVVATDPDNRVVGFMLYLNRPWTTLHVLNLAVDPACRHRLVGTQMIGSLKQALHIVHGEEIVTEVRESNLAAQLFLQRCGFESTDVRKSYYDDTPEDAYVFRWRSVCHSVPRNERSNSGGR